MIVKNKLVSKLGVVFLFGVQLICKTKIFNWVSDAEDREQKIAYFPSPDDSGGVS